MSRTSNPAATARTVVFAAGADGVMIEVHPAPERARSDGAQSLYPEQFASLMREIREIASAIGREILEPRRVGVNDR